MSGELPVGCPAGTATAVAETSTQPADVATGVPDHRVFSELFRAHADTVVRVLRRLGVPDADTEDVLQEVFVVVYRGLQGFRGDSSVKTWICGIAARKAMSHRRRRYLREEVPIERAPDASDDPRQHSHMERLDQRKLLGTLLAQLDDQKRDVFVLFELEELAMKDVAALVNAPLFTCYSRLRLARTQLKRQLEKVSVDGESI